MIDVLKTLYLLRVVLDLDNMKKITQEDIQYRQGRSKEQVEGHYFMAFIGFVGIAMFVLGFLLLTLFD